MIYNHISGYRAHTGQHVRRGETSAYAGTTGWSTGCHLHFTVMVDGSRGEPDGLVLRSPPVTTVRGDATSLRIHAREAAGYHGTVVSPLPRLRG